MSDYVSLGERRLGFLHCNPRHHSIAFVEMPHARKRINHFMLQLGSMDDVGRAYDQVNDAGMQLFTTLGKHSNDHMTSFYMANPSGYGVEYGWGAREVDDLCALLGMSLTGALFRATGLVLLAAEAPTRIVALVALSRRLGGVAIGSQVAPDDPSLALLRAAKVPVVAELADLFTWARPMDRVLLDGDRGTLRVHPSPGEIVGLRRRARDRAD